MTDACTTLSLVNSTAILTDLMKTRDMTLCDVCNQVLDSESYMICTNPVKEPSGKDTAVEINKPHSGHTACKQCVDDLSYIGDAASCIVCFRELGGRRSSIKNAGLALRPAVKNTMANKMIEKFMDAETTILESQERDDLARRKEGEERRLAAAEEVRRKHARAEEEAERVRARAAEEAAQAEQEAERVRARAAEEAAQAEEEAERVRARAAQEAAQVEQEAQRVRAQAVEEAARMRARAVEDAARVEETAKARMKEVEVEAHARVQREDDARRLAQALEDQERLDQIAQQVPLKRKRPVDPERIEKARRTREARKIKLARMDALEDECQQWKTNVNTKTTQLTMALEIAREFLSGAGISTDEFDRVIEKRLATVEEHELETESESGFVVD